MTYTVMVLGKHSIDEYGTAGQLFAVLKDFIIELTLWKRILSALEGFLECLCEFFSIPVDELLENILHNDIFSKECRAMGEALKTVREQDAA